MCCGTSLQSFQTGGLPEMIIWRNNWLVNKIEFFNFEDIKRNYLKSDWINLTGKDTILQAISLFDSQTFYKKNLDHLSKLIIFYKKLLKKIKSNFHENSCYRFLRPNWF